MTMEQAQRLYDEDLEASLHKAVQQLELEQTINADLGKELEETQLRLDNTTGRLDSYELA
jgi:hypothetical protein